MPSSRKASPRRRQTKSRAKAPARRYGRFIFLLFLGVALVGASWSVWIGYQVRQQFESLHWALPGRIYARPLELYANAHLSQQDLLSYLQRAGYQSVTATPQPGQYRSRDNTVELFTRGFRFWDGPEPARAVEVTFAGQRVSGLHSNSRPLALARLDPVEIAQINPETGEDRIPLNRDEVPETLVQALVAVEDQRFFKHYGVDPLGIARALYTNVLRGEITQGGSTLTQQLVKNLYLTRDRTLRRKLEEAVMAVALELQFGKDAILTAYINEVFLGQEGSRAIHGFALASEYYFGRPLMELKLPELAMLAGLPRGASWYNPLRHPERATTRRNTVLALMHDQGYIDADSYEQARGAPLGVSRGSLASSVRNGYPAFMELVYRDLARDYDKQALRSEGLRIFTTLDIRVQQTLEETLAKSVAAVERKTSGAPAALEAAAVVTDASTGEVRGLAGSRKSGYTGFNRALHAVRPVGSLIKPAVYLAALESRQFHLASVLADEPVSLKLADGQYWEPDNYDEFEEGDVYLFDALQRSLNLATVDLGMKLGLPKVVDMIGRLGHDEAVNAYPSLLLGSLDMAPVEVAVMYQTLASNGFRSGLRSVEAVTSASGQPLEYYGIRSQQAVDASSLFLLEQALYGVFDNNGTAKSVAGRLAPNLPLVGKTGTTNDLRDSWFAGYGDDLVGVVWLGYDDNRSSGLTGATGALQVWTELMSRLDIQPRQTLAPVDIVWEKVPRFAEREAAWRDCSETRTLPFREDVLPEAGWFCEASDSFFDRVMDRFR